MKFLHGPVIVKSQKQKSLAAPSNMVVVCKVASQPGVLALTSELINFNACSQLAISIRYYIFWEHSQLNVLSPCKHQPPKPNPTLSSCCVSQEDDTILVSTVADGTRLTFKRVRGSVTEAAGPSREGAVNSRSGAITGSEPAVAAEIAHITDSALPSPASTSPAAPSGPTGKNAPSLPKRATGGKAAIKVAAAPPAASTSAPAAVVDQNGASSNGSTNGNHGASSSSGVESEAQVSGSESAAHPQQQAQGNGRSSSVEAAVQGDEGSATFSTEELQAVAAMSAAAGGAEVTEIFLPGTRPVRFDPQHEMRTLVESGVDLSLDGGAMNTDDYTLPTEAG